MDSVWWFVACAVVTALHVAYLVDWRRESRERLKQWDEYDRASQRRHDEFMSALTWYRSAKGSWSDKRGKA